MARRKSMVGHGLALAMLLPLLGACRQGGSAPQDGAVPAASSGAPPRAVELSPRVSRFTGVIIAGEAVDLSSRFEGRLEKVEVQVGDKVKKGAAVARLDTQQLQSEQAIIQAELEAARAEVKLAELSAEEMKGKLARRSDPKQLALGAISEEELAAARYENLSAEARLAAARARVAQHEARLVQLQRQLEEAIIKAPFDGAVALRYLDPGAQLSPGKPIIHLLRAETPKVRFAIPVEAVGQVSVGAPVEVEVPELGVSLRGQVENLAPQVDAAARMVLGIAGLEGPPRQQLLAGMVVRVSPVASNPEVVRTGTPPP